MVWLDMVWLDRGIWKSLLNMKYVSTQSGKYQNKKENKLFSLYLIVIWSSNGCITLSELLVEGCNDAYKFLASPSSGNTKHIHPRSPSLQLQCCSVPLPADRAALSHKPGCFAAAPASLQLRTELSMMGEVDRRRARPLPPRAAAVRPRLEEGPRVDFKTIYIQNHIHTLLIFHYITKSALTQLLCENLTKPVPMSMIGFLYGERRTNRNRSDGPY
jgi:hypothetical protein